MLLGGKGCGKSRTAAMFGDAAGYKGVTFPLYKDMLSRDLLQRRSTDK